MVNHMLEIEDGIPFIQAEVQIAPTIRALLEGQSVFIPSQPQSVHTILTRIRREFPERDYRAKQEKGRIGIRVWRLK